MNAADTALLEREILAGLLEAPDDLDAYIEAGITGDAWHHSHTRALYALLVERHHKGEPNDLLSLLLLCQTTPALAATLADPTAAYAEDASLARDPDRRDTILARHGLVTLGRYASAYSALPSTLLGQLQRRALSDRIVAASRTLSTLARRGDLDTEAVLAEAESAALGIAGDLVPSRTTPAATAAQAARQRITRRRQGETETIPTGIADLDAGILGLPLGAPTLVAGRPGMGKTSLATSITINACRAGCGVLWFTLEMSEAQLTDKLLSQAGGVSSRAISEGRLGPGEAVRLDRALDELADWPLLIDDTSMLSAPALASKARRMARQLRRTHGVGVSLLVVDYIQLMRGEGSDIRQRIHSLSLANAALVKSLGCAQLLIAQLNRKCEERPDKRPQLSDLAESGQLENDAHTALFCYRDTYYSRDASTAYDAEILVAKGRNGGAGTYPVRFDPQTQRWSDRNVAHMRGGR